MRRLFYPYAIGYRHPKNCSVFPI